MILNGHCPLSWVHHASACAIIQVDVGDLDPLREGAGVDCIVVILGADLNAPCSERTSDGMAKLPRQSATELMLA